LENATRKQFSDAWENTTFQFLTSDADFPDWYEGDQMQPYVPVHFRAIGQAESSGLIERQNPAVVPAQIETIQEQGEYSRHPAGQATEERNQLKNSIRLLYRQYGLSSVMPKEKILNALSTDELKKEIKNLEIGHQRQEEWKEREQIRLNLLSLLKPHDITIGSTDLNVLSLDKLRLLHGDVRTLAGALGSGPQIRRLLSNYKVSPFSIRQMIDDDRLRQNKEDREKKLKETHKAQMYRNLPDKSIRAQENARKERDRQGELADKRFHAWRQAQDAEYIRDKNRRTAEAKSSNSLTAASAVRRPQGTRRQVEPAADGTPADGTPNADTMSLSNADAMSLSSRNMEDERSLRRYPSFASGFIREELEALQREFVDHGEGAIEDRAGDLAARAVQGGHLPPDDTMLR
jgi:hypothetical protein